MNRIAAYVKGQELAIFCVLTVALSFAATQLPLPGEAVCRYWRPGSTLAAAAICY